MFREMLSNQRDPSKWPTDRSETDYMVDCEQCQSRMPPAALPAHRRRHARHGA
jgi:hypothetical protein